MYNIVIFFVQVGLGRYRARKKSRSRGPLMHVTLNITSNSANMNLFCIPDCHVTPLGGFRRSPSGLERGPCEIRRLGYGEYLQIDGRW